MRNLSGFLFGATLLALSAMVHAWTSWNGPGAVGDIRGTVDRFGVVGTNSTSMASRVFVDFTSDLEFSSGPDGVCSGTQSNRRFLAPQEEEKEMLSILEFAISMKKKVYLNIFPTCSDGYNVIRTMSIVN